MATDRVLVVEDEDIVRDSMVRVLQRAGLDTEGVSSGEEALARMEDERYDVLLADIRMPGMGGLEFLERARDVDPQVAAMLITGYGTLESAIAAVDMGVQGYILKPVAPEELVAKVKGALGRIRALRELYRTRTLRPLLGLSSRLGSFGDMAQALEEAARVAGEECGALHVSIHLADEAGVLRLAASWGAHPDAQGMDAGQDESPQERVMRQGEMLLLRENARPAGHEDQEEGFQKVGAASALYLPIALRGDTVGVLSVLKGPGSSPMGEGDGAFLFLVCRLLAPVVADALPVQEGGQGGW